MNHWEYYTQPFDLNSGEDALEEVDKELNELGAAGWELATMLPKQGCQGNWCIGVFKRQVPVHDEVLQGGTVDGS